MINVALSRVSERMLIADPGLLRLRNALRSGLSCSLTSTLVVLSIHALHQSITLAALAAIIAMIGPLFVRDTNRSAWFITLFIICFSASSSFVAAAVLAPYPLVADLGFLAVFFTGILCQTCGPRALGSALTGIVTFYLGLYLHPALPQIGQALAYVLVAAAMMTIVGRLVLPNRPIATLRRAISTVTLRASHLLETHRTLPATAQHAQLSSMNEAALALEEHLLLLAPHHASALRECVVEIEVAAGQLRADIGQRSSNGGEALQNAIRRLCAATDNWVASHRTSHEASASTGASASITPTAVTLSATQRWNDIRSRLSWLHACRATIAAVLAMLIGHSLSPERWCWAVISVFVVFLGTRSRADTIHRGLERLGGTIAGALVSAALAVALHASMGAMIIAMMLCVFGWAYFILSSYSRGVFFITVLVGLIYAALGFAIVPLVTIRIEEVMAGCLVSFIVAMFFFPLAASRHIDHRLLGVLQNLRDTIQAAASTFERVAGAASDDALQMAKPSATAASQALAAMRKLDRSWHDLRIALRPFQTQRVFVWNPGYELITGSLLACLHWTRTLSMLADQANRSGAVLDTASADAASTAASVHAATADQMNGQRFSSILTRLDSLIASYRDAQIGAANAAALREQLAGFDSITVDPAVPPTLQQLDGAVVLLVQRLSASADYRPGLWAALGLK